MDIGATDCQIYQPISWSVNDTDQTIAEIKEYNAVRKDRCK